MGGVEARLYRSALFDCERSLGDVWEESVTMIAFCDGDGWSAGADVGASDICSVVAAWDDGQGLG